MADAQRCWKCKGKRRIHPSHFTAGLSKSNLSYGKQPWCMSSCLSICDSSSWKRQDLSSSLCLDWPNFSAIITATIWIQSIVGFALLTISPNPAKKRSLMVLRYLVAVNNRCTSITSQPSHYQCPSPELWLARHPVLSRPFGRPLWECWTLESSSERTELL